IVVKEQKNNDARCIFNLFTTSRRCVQRIIGIFEIDANPFFAKIFNFFVVWLFSQRLEGLSSNFC
ncbi:hypothetical protein, partial [Avibacterium endocarditidis]